jgi:hypothetical protein
MACGTLFFAIFRLSDIEWALSVMGEGKEYTESTAGLGDNCQPQTESSSLAGLVLVRRTVLGQ